MNLGNALGMLYLLYYLQDEVGLPTTRPRTGVYPHRRLRGVSRPPRSSAGASDRLGRRKVFVIWSGSVIAVALLFASS